MSYRTAYPNELCHYGVLGMKWGVRRYQNYDGTRIGTGGSPVIKKGSLKGSVRNAKVGTGEVQRLQAKNAQSSKANIAGGQGGKAVGAERLAAKAPSTSDVLFGPQVKKGKDKEKSSNVKEMLKDIGDAAEGAGKLAENAKKRDKKVKEANEMQKKQRQKEARQMSDKELRDSINRIKMEREYTSLTTKEVETGYDKFKDIMGEVKDVAVTAAAIAGLVLTIIKIKNSLGHSDVLNDDQVAELNRFIEGNDYDDEFIAHAMDLDVDYIIDYFDLSDEFLEHHGIKGMKWGVRRFQNYDGTRIGTGSGVGGGGGGGSKASKSFRDKYNLAASHLGTSKAVKKDASMQNTKRSKNTQDAIDAYKKADKIYWDEIDPLRDKLIKAENEYGVTDSKTKTIRSDLVNAMTKRDTYVKTYVDKFKKIPYDEIDDDVLRLGQHSYTWTYGEEVDPNIYKGPTISKGGKTYKHESSNPYVEVLGDAPGGELALRRKPKVVDTNADKRLKQKLEKDLKKSQKQDSRDYYRIKTFGK